MPTALIYSRYHETVRDRVNYFSQCGLSEVQILSASKKFETLCRKPIVQLRELLDRNRRELIEELLMPWARTIRQDHSPPDPRAGSFYVLLVFSTSFFPPIILSLHATMFPCKLDCLSFSSRQQVHDLIHLVECHCFNSKEVLKLGTAGNWTRDLSHPKRESYP